MKTIRVVAAVIRDGERIDTVEYDYPQFHLSMDCFWCSVVEGELTLLEAEEARWLAVDELDLVEWLPADVLVVGKVKEGIVPKRNSL